MINRIAITKLRKVLERLYEDVSDIRRVVYDAGINTSTIEFQGSASSIWFSVLDNAEKQDRLESLINIVHCEYPNHQELSHVSAMYQQRQQSANSTNPTQLRVLHQENNQWRNYEVEGDHQVKLAGQADQKDTDKHWQAAQQAYNQALGTQPRPDILDMIRLYRKAAFVLRKQGKIDLAKHEYLHRGYNLIPRVNASLQESPTLLLEKALYQLEDAYCDYNEDKWQELQAQTAEMIEQYSDESIIELDANFPYVIGCVYNLRAIVLQYLSAPQGEIDWCWDLAQSYLQRANTADATDILRDIRLNRAAHQTMWGHTDSAIKTFEQVLLAEKMAPSLPTERRIILQHTLATCYLDRRAEDEISKARALATENLIWSKMQERIDEWFAALYLYLDVMKALIVTTKENDTQSFVEQALDEYYAFRRANRFGKAWGSKPAASELHRLLAEIYIVANDLVKAEAEVAFFKTPPQQEEERNEGYFYLTLARFHHRKGEFEEAQLQLQKARSRFEDAEQGMVVEIDLLWAEIKTNQSKEREAQQLLEQALENAQMLDCEERVTRVKERLRNLQ
jgi:hypothetical protein